MKSNKKLLYIGHKRESKNFNDYFCYVSKAFSDNIYIS